MRSSKPDIQAARRPEIADIDAINDVFADSFTDRYRRDGLSGVSVPRLNPAVWRYAIEGAGDGAKLWCGSGGEVVAFNMAHRSGAEGWMGPLAVRPTHQGLGIGTEIVGTATEWLRTQEVATIGLETMPRTVDNVGFYSGMGFLPGHLTITMVGDVAGGSGKDVVSLQTLSAADRDALLLRCRERLDRSARGYDFTREMELTLELGLGDAMVIEDGEVKGFGLWHSASLIEARPAEELRLLKLFADSVHTFNRLMDGIGRCAVRTGLGKIVVRCQTVSSVAFTRLIEMGYRVRWTDLRMVLNGYPEVVLPHGEVLLSNWEI